MGVGYAFSSIMRWLGG